MGAVDLRAQMQYWRGIWLPATDTHMIEQMGDIAPREPTYQKRKLDEAMKYVRRRRLAVDIGAHVGLWSIHLARSFDRVEAFEPVPLHQACWRENMLGYRNVQLHPFAVGASGIPPVKLTGRPDNTGETWVVPDEVGSCEVVDLDHHLMLLRGETLDFLKIDVEGFEYAVVQGALDLINTDMPVIVLEQNGPHALKYGTPHLAARDLLLSFGYETKAVMGDDHIMAPA